MLIQIMADIWKCKNVLAGGITDEMAENPIADE